MSDTGTAGSTFASRRLTAPPLRRDARCLADDQPSVKSGSTATALGGAAGGRRSLPDASCWLQCSSPVAGEGTEPTPSLEDPASRTARSVVRRAEHAVGPSCGFSYVKPP